ncbi:MAG: hypothetical protein JJ896_12725 [Rhodothermales bacterium]|nr:hypothetical protein [Rhodothermales bacterium]MBO6780511.1 hypothetical protein [Rhodothermales bacterium]
MVSSRSLLLAASIVTLTACAGSHELVPSDADVVLAEHLLDAPDPAQPGPFQVRALYYGSGEDKRRPEFRDSVAVVTDSVDASKLVDLGSSEGSRTRYWGFGAEAFPINGRVWHPEGEGPFPLVLVVHGNHNMKDFSDPGYAYLGRHLASRGFILVSVDMNFINGGVRQENDARGWLLLKHLAAWRSFNEDPEHPLHGLADLDRVSLIGHSRGGEAVGHAAAFNRLSHYPDDGSVEFDFNFGIRSIAAIAPVDGQYLPTGRHVPVSDVSYLVFHGSHDGDVTSFHGLRQYQRTELTPGTDQFKAAVYMYRANHGQWNEVWNSRDWGPRSGRTLDLSVLIEPEAQRHMALVYLTAFLEATLKDNPAWLPLFRDHRVAGDWLPDTIYITRYQHNSFVPLADFEEDIDLTTGSTAGVHIAADSLSTWREEPLVLRSRNRTSTSNQQQTQAARLSWEQDSTDVVPEYRIAFDDPPRELRAETTLDLLLSPDGGSEPDSLATPGAFTDLSVRVTDAQGNQTSVPLSAYGPIRAPLEIGVMRRNMDKSRFGRTWEIVLQSFSIPLGDFHGIDPASIREVALVFDLRPKGTVIVDEIGFAEPGPAFLRARLPQPLPASAN